MRNCIDINDWKDYAMVRTRNGRGWNHAAPLFLWDDKFRKQPNLYLELVRRISDSLLFTGNSIMDADFPNRPELSRIVSGEIRDKDYWEADYVYGQKSIIPVRDNHFFEGSKNFMLGKIAAQPFKFYTQTASNEFSKAMRRKAADETAKAIMNVATEGLAQQGYQGIKGMGYRGINTKMPMDKLLQSLNPQEQIEYLVSAILLDANLRHNFGLISQNCFDNRYDIRACFAAVGIEYGELVGKHLPPAQVHWLANKPVETFEDPAVLACGYYNFLTMEDMLVKYGKDLYSSHGVKSLRQAVKLINDGEDFRYNPMGNLYEGSTYSTIEELSPEPDDMGFVKTQQINWKGQDFTGAFYPLMKIGGTYRSGILEHKGYFKLVENRRFLLKIDGKVVSPQEFRNKLKDHNWERRYKVDVEQVEQDYKSKPGQNTVELPVAQMHEFTRLGHSVLTNVGRYEYANPTNGREMGWPIVANISRKKSFARMGEYFARRVNILYQRLDELLIQMGHQTAVMLDETQEGDPVSFLYNMKRTGIARYNSSKAQGGSIMAQRHLQTVTIGGNDAAEAERLLTLIGFFQTLFDSMIGAGPQAQGVYQKYSGVTQTQMNVENQNVLQQKQLAELDTFMNDFLQRYADVGTKFYADDEERTFSISPSEQVVLKTIREMSLAQIQIKLRSGQDLAQKKDKVEKAAMQVLSGAGVEFLEPMLDIILEENVVEARALLRSNIEYLKQIEQKNQERQMQAQEAQNQAIQQRTQMDMDKELERTRRAVQVQQLKNQDEEDDRLSQGEMQEFNAAEERDRLMLQDMMQKNTAS